MEDIVTWTAFTFRKTISNYLDKLSDGNANFICLFPQDLKNINHMGEDMSKEEFRKFCYKSWEKPYSFAVIDLTSRRDAGKYRDGLDNFYIPKKNYRSNNKWKIF